MRVLLNAISCKKHAGGAFQIALNFINACVKRDDVDWYFLVSSDLDFVLAENFDHMKGKRYFAMPTQPDFFGSYYSVKRDIERLEVQIKPDIVYSIISPSYFSFKAPEVMRFANAWVTNPNVYANSTLSLKSKIRNYFYCWNQKRLMKKRKFFITQSETVKNGIKNITNLDDDRIKVIPNVLPHFFSTSHNIETIPKDRNIVQIACVGAPFPHKNIDIIADVALILKERYKISNVKFLTTIPGEIFESSFKKKLIQNSVVDNVINFGYVSQKELFKLYSQSDICFITSLLETFSATILEAMFFNLSIVASDFNFNKEITEESALYFDPKNAESAASNIASLVNNLELREELKSKMAQRLEKYLSYDLHVDNTINFLLDCLNHYKKTIN